MSDNITLQYTCLAKCPANLETILASELEALGASDIQVLHRAVAFKGDKRLLYAANYQCRTALRILVPVATFSAETQDDFYQKVKNVRWEDYFSSAETFAINTTLSGTLFTHSHFVSQRAKDAIADRFRQKTGIRPSVNISDPDFRINVHLFNNEVTVSLDSSGDSLHKRGYHLSNAEAPLSEVLAAGMILLSGWDGNSHFVDPMCGSGTLLIEAALIAMKLPAGYFRESYGFMKWKDFDASLWKEVKQQASRHQCALGIKIIGSDISAVNLRSAAINVKKAGLHHDIGLRTGPFMQFVPPEAPGVLITNPPYGGRIQVNDIIELYRDLGNALKRNFSGYKAWVISADQKALKMIGLRPMKKTTLYNGPLECIYAGYELYEGSKKASKQNE